MMPIERLDGVEADKLKKEKREEISENKKSTSQNLENYLELKDGNKIQVLNGACLEDSLDNKMLLQMDYLEMSQL